MAAFREIAPQSVASTSSSKNICYDVFINHRGTNVKHTLARDIYNRLEDNEVKAFLDQQELEPGDCFPQEIEEAMRSASIHIAIFSPNYAQSPWCLEELLFMLRIGVTIIPVFYHVDPSDLRYPTKGMYADALRQHWGKRKYNSDEPRYNKKKIDDWEEALSSVSYLTGCMLDADNDEGKLLGKIVDTTLQRIEKARLDVAKFPVGLDQAVEDFESKVGSSTSSSNVHIVGIVGMGGAGKTTLAKELYNRKCSSKRSSFLSDVRYAASTNNLHNLQLNLLNDLRIEHSVFHNKHKGKEMLARAIDLKFVKVLIVLDDVDDVDQIDDLLPQEMMQNLGRGSLIIVTTREKDVLTSFEISSIYEMKLLDPFNAKQLFRRHAFSEYNHNFEHLTEEFVKACNGLPLSLIVLGAMVKGQSMEYWDSQLRKLSRILPNKIVESLQLSYDALDNEVQEMFLDIACLFIAEQKSRVVTIWDGSGWDGEVGWQILVNKCLVTSDEQGCIHMHDHLRDLGRKIATTSGVSPSHIWEEGQICLQGERTRGIITAKIKKDPQAGTENSMKKIIKGPSLPRLQLLAVRGDDLNEEFLLSRDLVWLRWCDFEGTSLPSWLSLANLRVLELYPQNLEELWQDNVQLLQLRELIVEFRNSSRAQQARRFELPRSIGHLRHLTKLELKNIDWLTSLPDDFGELINLRVLVLSGTSIFELPNSFKQLRLLQILEISYCWSLLLMDLHVLEFMTELQILRFKGISSLEKLPLLTTQLSLRELDLRDTSLIELPNSIGQLPKLETLSIGSKKLISLPASLGELSNLTSFVIDYCELLESLPETLWGLSNPWSLQIDNCKLLASLPEELGCQSNLRLLRIISTPIVELGRGIGCNLKSLTYLSLWATRVCRISISDDYCPSLEKLFLCYNEDLTEIETLPGNLKQIQVVEGHKSKLKNMRGIGGLLNLERLELRNCPDLEVFPCPEYMHCVDETEFRKLYVMI